eukprot:361853-Chlamydomonas_euryale.AAC.3
MMQAEEMMRQRMRALHALGSAPYLCANDTFAMATRKCAPPRCKQQPRRGLSLVGAFVVAHARASKEGAAASLRAASTKHCLSLQQGRPFPPARQAWIACVLTLVSCVEHLHVDAAVTASLKGQRAASVVDAAVTASLKGQRAASVVEAAQLMVSAPERLGSPFSQSEHVPHQHWCPRTVAGTQYACFQSWLCGPDLLLQRL